MGLRDQLLAVQWVQANIHHFGGDPSKITIFGYYLPLTNRAAEYSIICYRESAGGISVQAQVVSPHSAGLLAGAIAQSGSILYLSTQTPGEEQVRGHPTNLSFLEPSEKCDF